uniref:Uncharacterized protein n=1 Tax=Octopus bimaculoides TaxID=37653 RepID=A0A0L8GBL6_OCTBM
MIRIVIVAKQLYEKAFKTFPLVKSKVAAWPSPVKRSAITSPELLNGSHGESVHENAFVEDFDLNTLAKCSTHCQKLQIGIHGNSAILSIVVFTKRKCRFLLPL